MQPQLRSGWRFLDPKHTHRTNRMYRDLVHFTWTLCLWGREISAGKLSAFQLHKVKKENIRTGFIPYLLLRPTEAQLKIGKAAKRMPAAWPASLIQLHLRNHQGFTCTLATWTYYNKINTISSKHRSLIFGKGKGNSNCGLRISPRSRQRISVKPIRCGW